MPWLAQFDFEKFLLFTLVLARVSGLTLTAPIYGTREVPLQVRALLAFTIGLLVVPTQWGVSPVVLGSTLQYLGLLVSELLVGLLLGLGIVFLFSSVQLAGGLIGRLGGLTMADVFDPASGESGPLLGRFMYLLALAVFVALGGHRLVLEALLDTFQALPPGNMALPSSMAGALVTLLSQSFALGLRVAAPVVVALLLSTLVLGLIGRTLPQLNLLAVGFGLNSMLTFGILAIVLGSGAMVFQSQVGPTLELMVDALRSPESVSAAVVSP